MTLNIQLDDYLKQWFIHSNGGSKPVKLIKGSVEAKVLEVFLTTPPDECDPDLPGPDTVAIEIPQFKSKDTRYYFYLPKMARQLLLQVIRERFDIQLFSEIHRFRNVTKQLDSLIGAFMEKHGIDFNETNFNAVLKRYRRQRDIYRRSERRKINDEKN